MVFVFEQICHKTKQDGGPKNRKLKINNYLVYVMKKMTCVQFSQP